MAGAPTATDTTAVPGDGTGLDEQVEALLEDRLLLAAHEVRQPVSVVLALAELARQVPGTSPEALRVLDRLVEQTQELSAVVGSVLGRPEAVPARPVDAVELVDSVCTGVTATWPGTVVRRGRRGALPVSGSRATLRRCLVNVVGNAVRAAGPYGTVAVTVRTVQGMVHVEVEDDGPGFGQVSAVTGLGLAVTRQSMAAVGGSLRIGRSPDTGGARVGLVIPPWLADGDVPHSVRAG